MTDNKTIYDQKVKTAAEALDLIKDGDYILFGSESKGVYDYIHERLDDHAIKIPIREDSDRSLNLANAVNIVLYEAMRQLNFEGMR